MDVLPSPLDLARFQFAFVVVWHFLFPAFASGWPTSWWCSKSCGPGQSSPPTSRLFGCLRKASTVLPAGRSSNLNPRNLTSDTYGWWLL